MNYLYFFLKNSDIEYININQVKKDILKEHSFIYENYTKNGLTGNDQEMFDIIEDIEGSANLIGEKLWKEVQALIDNLPTGSNYIDDNLNMSYHQAGYIAKIKDTTAQAQRLVTNLNNFIVKADSYMDEIVDLFCRYYPKIVQIALLKCSEEYNNRMSDVDFIQKYLKSGVEIFEIDDVKDLSTHEKTIMNQIGRIQQLINALSLVGNLKNGDIDFTYTSSHKKQKDLPDGGKITTKSKLISILLGKLGGCFSYAGGSVEELCEGLVFGKALSFATKVNNDITFESSVDSKAVSTSVSKDSGLTSLRDNKGHTFTKGDVTLSIIKGEKVILKYGGQVKISKSKNENIRSNVSLEKESNFSAMLDHLVNKKIVSKRYINHIAASHDFYNYPESVVLDEESLGGYSEKEELRDAWTGLVDIAVFSHFFSSIVGYNKNIPNLVLSINRKIFPLSEILYLLQDNPQAINYTSKGGNVRQRSYFSHLNYMIGSKQRGYSNTAARLRSNIVQQRLELAYSKFSITTKLNFKTLYGSGAIPQL